jgi:hypothetical protein
MGMAAAAHTRVFIFVESAKTIWMTTKRSTK